MSTTWRSTTTGAERPHPDMPAPAAPVPWRAFLRALAQEMEAQAGPEAAAGVLRGAGEIMARLLTLPPVGSMEALALEMNAVLAEIAWGQVSLVLNESERCVVITHIGLPRIGGAGDPPGSWLAPVLEGLYEAWMAQQPGSDEMLRARVQQIGDVVVLHYRRY